MDLKIVRHFKKVDSVLYVAYSKISWEEEESSVHLKGGINYFRSLCREIIGQQLSTKVAKVIFERFANLFEGEDVNPKKAYSLSIETLRGIGMSYAKAKYVNNLAELVLKGEVHLDKFDQMEDEEVIEELVKVKGIGRWTAEMFLMFCLNREDVFSHGDLGLRRAIQNLYKFKGEPSKEEIEEIVSKWSPYKSYGCRILWRSLD